MCKLLYKPKDRVATEDKNNIISEIDCSNCEAVFFGESKRSLKWHSDEHKKSVRNCNCEINEITKHCWEGDYSFSWDQKKVVGWERSRSKKPYILSRILITLTKFSTCFVKYGFLIFVSS